MVHSIGEPIDEEFYVIGVWREFTDYGVYRFKAANLAKNRYLKPLTESGRDAVTYFLDDFEHWVTAGKDTGEELSQHYRFDRSVLSHTDYVYVQTKYEGNPFAFYNLYLFDSETNTLYYFHNNN